MAAMIAGDKLAALAHYEPQSRYSLEHVEAAAKEAGDGWQVSGSKSVVLGGGTADWLIVSARTSGKATDRDGISLFIVDGKAPGVAIRDYGTVDGYAAAEIALDAAVGLFTIVIIIGGILTGVFTATESAAVAVAYAVLVTLFVYKSLDRRAVGRIFATTLTTLAIVTAIIMTSSVFGFLLSYLRVPALLADGIFAISEHRVFVLLSINLLLLVLGMLMDMGILILILTPILLPIVTKVGVDPIQFGIILVLNLGIGLCTPPVGTSLIVGCGIARISLERTVRSLFPFYAAMVFVLILVTYIPALSLTLPAWLR